MRRGTNRRLACLLGILLISGSCSEPIVPTGPSLDPVTETFASQISPRGWATRMFRVRDTGSVTVTLTALSTSNAVGVGVGIPPASGGNCNLSRSVETTAGTNPQIVTTADGGSYCVKIWDLGTLSDATSFSITIVHP